MIVQGDVSGLEIGGAAFLSGDETLIAELMAGVDIHGANQKEFGLPTGNEGRLIAKILIFRILYGGSAFGFVNDAKFAEVSTSTKYWEKVIERFFTKYPGIRKWHEKIVREVSKTGCITTPTGRMYEWDLMETGTFKVNEPQVKNYMVQGFGADLVVVARVSFARRFWAAGIEGKLINTVHDSIVVDVADNSVSRVNTLFQEVFRDVPANINKIFNIGFNLNVGVEVLVGHNQGELYEVET